MLKEIHDLQRLVVSDKWLVIYRQLINSKT